MAKAPRDWRDKKALNRWWIETVDVEKVRIFQKPTQTGMPKKARE
jgi:hypothetical protein